MGRGWGESDSVPFILPRRVFRRGDNKCEATSSLPGVTLLFDVRIHFRGSLEQPPSRQFLDDLQHRFSRLPGRRRRLWPKNHNFDIAADLKFGRAELDAMAFLNPRTNMYCPSAHLRLTR